MLHLASPPIMNTEAFILDHEPVIRLVGFLATLVIMALWQMACPHRSNPVVRTTPWVASRWASNLAIAILNSAIVRLLFPAAAVGMAALAEIEGWGLFGYLPLPGWLTVMVSLVMLDLLIWLQHVVFHAVPWLWRLHRVHHADLEVDVTTGVRFHPVEIVLSMAIKMAAVTLLGAPVLAVVTFEVLLNASSLFNHSNVRIPGHIDRILRLVVVTPDMHRVHHSLRHDETRNNFGFNLPWWDHLFGTYRAQPHDDHRSMSLGIEAIRDRRTCSWLPGMLAIPFLPAASPQDEPDTHTS